MAKSRAASAIREAILSHPDIPQSVAKNLSREAGLANARKWVERATNRGGNLDPISLDGIVFGMLIEGGLPGTVAYRIAKSQPVMSRLGIRMGNFFPGTATKEATRVLPFFMQQSGQQEQERPTINWLNSQKE